MGFRVAVVAAFAYGLWELAFFVQRNHLLPWTDGHVQLGGIFAGLHLVIALLVLFGARLLTRFSFVPPTLPVFAPMFALIAIHALTFFRERYYGLPRNLVGTLGSLAIVLVAVGLAIFAGVQLALVRALGEQEAVLPRAETHQLEATETGQRVVVFGYDGATWDLFDPLIAAGKLPNLERLIQRGRTMNLETFKPTFSPVIWTSVSTGKDRFQHGIHDVIQTKLPGGVWLHRSIVRTAFFTKTTGVIFRWMDEQHLLPLAPYRSSQVRVTSVFEAASEAGLSTSCIEWYTSYPAEPLSGVRISDRFHLQNPADGPDPEAVAPSALGEHLLKHVVTGEDVPKERVLDFIDARGLEGAAADEWVEENESFVEEMRLNLARDLSTRNVAVDLLQRDQDWKLFGVYFRAVDLTHHLTWGRRDKEGDPTEDPDVRFGPVIRNYYEFMDQIVGDVLAEVPDDAVVLMLSDHGFEDRYAHSQAPDGFAIVAGGPTVPSSERGRFHLYDVAPTVAALIGVPVAQDLQAKPRLDLFDDSFLLGRPPREISTWEKEGRREAASGDEIEVDAAELDRLRALGYIQ